MLYLHVKYGIFDHQQKGGKRLTWVELRPIVWTFYRETQSLNKVENVLLEQKNIQRGFQRTENRENRLTVFQVQNKKTTNMFWSGAEESGYSGNRLISERSEKKLLKNGKYLVEAGLWKKSKLCNNRDETQTWLIANWRPRTQFKQTRRIASKQETWKAFREKQSCLNAVNGLQNTFVEMKP